MARPSEARLHRALERVTGWLLCLMLLFNPWAFGTTEEWSTWTMNVGGYALGLLLLTQWILRWRGAPHPLAGGPPLRGARICVGLVGAATVLIIAYAFIAAWNARANYDRLTGTLLYRETIEWLPASYDAAMSWYAFWMYLGLACAFWALRDWLTGLSPREQQAIAHGHSLPSLLLPARWRSLLWVLGINGGVLAIEGMLQRFDGSGKLLWIVQPVVNPGADAQFGPWAYRANAAQYFNLLWPVILGFWWSLQKMQTLGIRWGSRAVPNLHHLLLLSVLVMLVCPILSLSRGGAMITVVTLLAALGVLVAWQRSVSIWTKLGYILVLGLGVGLGFYLEWDQLGKRMDELGAGYDTREAIYASARRITADYPYFGTGPLSFDVVFGLYRSSLDEYWPHELHNDWLETLITWGWVGSSFVALALMAVLLRWFFRGGVHGDRRFVALIWIALAGVMGHARFDFPFQIHSVVFLFLVWCALLLTATRSRPKAS